jgi:pilus assembly protein CpaF
VNKPNSLNQLNPLKHLLQPLAGYLNDPEITDILIYGSRRVYARKRGCGFTLTGVTWQSDEDLMTIAKSIGREMKRRLDEREPILDARLPDKSRVNIVVAPCYDHGACIVIRKFPEQHFTLTDLESFGAIDRNGQKILEIIMRYGRNVMIAGGTGSGKTTLLNSLCGFIPPHDIVVTVEDAREIALPCDLWVALETKRALDENDRDVTLRDLIRTSLRMNPRWVIVGEVRGAEALDLVRACNTGHFSVSTIHASSATGALGALESLILQAGLDVSARAVKEMVHRAIHIVVHVEALPDHSRKLMEIIEVEGLDYDRSPHEPPYKTRTLYRFEFDRYDENGKAKGRFFVEEPPSWLHKLKLIPDFDMPDFWRDKQLNS